MARTGAISGQMSGDLAVLFSTNSRQERLDAAAMTQLFRATTEASEEAILNALFMAETTSGRDGHVIEALPIADTLDILRKHRIPV
jgi:D-aminopeptidase